jgi:hypothetical protein
MANSIDSEWPWQKPAKPVARGAFIVVEGLDRAGKTTQVKNMCEKLYGHGHNVKTLRFPCIGVPSFILYPIIIFASIFLLFHTVLLKYLIKSRPNNTNWQNDRQLPAE